MFQLKEYQRRCLDKLAAYFRKSEAFGVRRQAPKERLAALGLAECRQPANRGRDPKRRRRRFAALPPHSKGQAVFDACGNCGWHGRSGTWE
jgi:hypothetical protein